MSELGDLLRKLRGKRSLREVAEITQLSHTYISDVENGYRRGSKTPINPSPDTLKRLSDAYNYPYEELMKKAGYINEVDPEIITEVNGEKIRLTIKEYEVLKELKRHSITFNDLKSNPEKKVKQMITSWRKMQEALKEIEDDDKDYID